MPFSVLLKINFLLFLPFILVTFYLHSPILFIFKDNMLSVISRSGSASEQSLNAVSSSQQHSAAYSKLEALIILNHL